MKFFLLVLVLFVCSSCFNEPKPKQYVIEYEHINSPVTSTLNTITFPDVNTGFIGAEDGRILRSTNVGQTWTEIFKFGGSVKKLLFKSAIVGYACTSVGLYHTIDGGTTWQKLKDGSFTAITFPSGNRTVASSTVAVYTNDDDNNVWSEAVMPAGFKEIYDLSFESSSTGYAVGDMNAIYLTRDGGANWIQVITPQSSKKLFDAYSRPGFTLFAGTGGQFLMRQGQGGDLQLIPSSLYPLRAIDIRVNKGVIVGESTLVFGDLAEVQDWQYYKLRDESLIPGNYFSVAYVNTETILAVGANGRITKFLPPEK